MAEQKYSEAAASDASEKPSAAVSSKVSSTVSPAVSAGVDKAAELAQALAHEKRVLGWAHTARFLTTASQLDQLPQTELPEIAFVGRSNAGKSTAINTLTQQKRLAFASKTPGRTQHINLFELGPKLQADSLFADLPGYGYAAVARGAKLRWQKVMANYLDVRRSLVGVVLMVDSRLGFTDLDRQLMSFVAPRVGNGSVKLLVLLTKSDKLNRAEATAALASAQAALGEITTDEADVGMALFSALKKVGVVDAAAVLHEWVHPEPGEGAGPAAVAAVAATGMTSAE